MSDRFTIKVGELTFACSEGRVTTELNKPDKASGTVAADDLARRVLTGPDQPASPSRATT